MPERQRKGRDLIRKSAQAVEPAADGDLSGFAIVLTFALSSLVFAFSPSYLNLARSSVASDSLLSIALALLLWAIVGLLTRSKRLAKCFSMKDGGIYS